MKIENEIPRRNRLDLNTPAEVAIFKAMQEVEKAGADERLTKSSMLLLQAKNLIADYIEGIDSPIEQSDLRSELIKFVTYLKDFISDKYEIAYHEEIIDEYLANLQSKL